MFPFSAEEFERLRRMLIEQMPAVPEDDVRREMVRGFRELDGQIRPPAMAEMLHALVRYRLGRRVGDRSAAGYRMAS